MTKTATISWGEHRFAAIEVSRAYDEGGRPAYDTIGHAKADCKRIKSRPIVTDSSLVAFCEQNEWFDGEYIYNDPWPCQCLPIEKLHQLAGAPPPDGIDAYTGEIVSQEAFALTDDVLGKAFAVARKLGRKFVDLDLTDDLRAAAHQFADEYEGDFPFMIKAKAMANQKRTDPVLRAVLNCLRADALRSQPSAPQASLADTKASAGPPVPARSSQVVLSLPAGKYDVPRGDKVVTLEISHGSNNWEGWIFVREAGNKVGQQKPGETYRGQYVDLIERLSADPETAAALYGRRTSTCGICGIRLEDPESVARGIGPICAGRLRS